MQCRFLHGQGWGAWTFVGVVCCHSSLYRGVGGTVLCPCMQKPGHSCTMTCMGQDLRALGIFTHRAHGQGTCIAHPSAFNDQWGLKLGPPLQSSWAVQDVALANLYTSVLINILPFIRSWGALLLSCAAWVNMGLLSGRSTAVALRAAHWVLTRVVARTPYAIDPSRKCIAFLIPHLPATKAVIAGLICQWLQRTATWDKYKYASCARPCYALSRAATNWR